MLISNCVFNSIRNIKLNQRHFCASFNRTYSLNNVFSRNTLKINNMCYKSYTVNSTISRNSTKTVTQICNDYFRIMARNKHLAQIKSVKAHKPKRFDKKLVRIGWGITTLSVIISTCLFGKISLLLFLVPLLALHRRDLYVLSRVWKRDSIFIRRYVKCLLLLRRIATEDLNVNKFFKKNTMAQPDNLMIQMKDKEWTYRDMSNYANKIARYFQSHNLEKGDVCGVFAVNCPEFIGIILGTSQLGAICALVNTNLRMEPLAHCFNIADCKFIVVSDELIPTFNEIKADLNPKIKVLQLCNKAVDPKYKILADEIKKESEEYPEVHVDIHNDDHFIYIYTSGTTGLPKAAVIPHSKFIVASMGPSILMGMQKGDKFYDPLPLYHTTGLVCGVGAAINYGIPVVIKPKFSARKYFMDIKRYNCTVGQYIGEMCRYLLLTPESASDKDHSDVRLLGNGLNAANWEALVKRFNVVVTELYGATEGNCNMLNIDGKIGAVGFLPKMIPKMFYPYYLIRVTEDDQRPIRGSDGLCQRVNYGEPGMLVGLISSRADTKFHGYLSKDTKNKSESKIIENVFRKGDRAFMSGDMLEIDQYLYFYFKDRTGDTYRWQGENVSTVEVEVVVSLVLKDVLCSCYGVEVPGYEGKPGMVALLNPGHKIDLDKLAKDLNVYLPKYAVPRFVRIVDTFEMTGTHKIKKMPLIKDGIDLNVVKDCYYLDKDKNTYVPLTPEKLVLIQKHQIEI